jgi:hypothetical protein
MKRILSVSHALTLTLFVGASGCRTTAETVSSCCGSFWPPAPAPAEVATHDLLPPPPAPENLKFGMSAHPPSAHTADFAQPRFLEPSSPAAGTLYRPPISAPPLAPSTAALGPEPPPEPPPAPPAAADPALETRLTALEAECRQKLAALESLENRYQSQSHELSQVREQLTASQGNVATLTELVGDLQQRDVASLEQLSQKLDGLLETPATPVPAEAH